jgi:hypothetical protein
MIAFSIMLLPILFGLEKSGEPADCIIGKNCFAVIQPYLFERVCFLYANEQYHNPNTDLAVTLPNMELHPDRLHTEFLKMMKEKKFLSLTKGTPISGCQYDLSTINQSDAVTFARTDLPEFNCNGVLSRLVLIKPLNISTCYWVAVEDVVCR